MATDKSSDWGCGFEIGHKFEKVPSQWAKHWGYNILGFSLMKVMHENKKYEDQEKEKEAKYDEKYDSEYHRKVSEDKERGFKINTEGKNDNKSFLIYKKTSGGSTELETAIDVMQTEKGTVGTEMKFEIKRDFLPLSKFSGDDIQNLTVGFKPEENGFVLSEWICSKGTYRTID